MSRVVPRWLWAGILCGCCATALIFPESRWHVLDGFHYALGSVPSWQRAIALPPKAREVLELPDVQKRSYDDEVAVATLGRSVYSKASESSTDVRERIAALLIVRNRYPEKPAIYAHLGRYYAAILRLNAPTVASKPSLSERADWLRLRSLMLQAIDLPEGASNAYFFQMLAAAHLGLGETEKARGAWLAASDKPIWVDYAEREVFAQWQLLDSLYGSRGPRQRFPSLAMLRLPHLALINDAAVLLCQPAGGVGVQSVQDVDMCLATAKTGALIRDRALEVVAGLRGAAIVEFAIHGGAASRSPKETWRMRGDFRALVERTYPGKVGKALSAWVRDEANANDGYVNQIPPTASAAVEFTGWNTVAGRPGAWTGWLFRSIAMGALAEGSLGVALWMLALCLMGWLVLEGCRRWHHYLPERLRGALSVGAGAMAGFAAYAGSDRWFIGLWFALVIGGIGYVASATDRPTGIPAAGTDYITWSWGHTAATALILAAIAFANVYGFVFRYADFPAVHRALTGVESPFPIVPAENWRVLMWFVASLPLFMSVVWAGTSGMPLIPSTAQGLVRFAVAGTLTFTVLFFAALPIVVVYDRKDVDKLTLIARNEPGYYRRSAAAMETRYDIAR